jgi:hypothetical protein
MPVTWGFHGHVLELSVIGVVTNQEIAQAFDEAIANAPSKTGLRLLWDASGSLTPVSSDDMAWRFELVSSLAERGVLSRAALLVRKEHTLILELFRAQLQQGLPAIPSAVFSDATEARTWLES